MSSLHITSNVILVIFQSLILWYKIYIKVCFLLIFNATNRGKKKKSDNVPPHTEERGNKDALHLVIN